MGNMVVSHMGASCGDTPDIKRVQTGLLGCDYEVADGRYPFARVYSARTGTLSYWRRSRSRL